VDVHVIADRVQYYESDGKLITESLKDYTREAVRNDYRSIDESLTEWDKAERKTAMCKVPDLVASPCKLHSPIASRHFFWLKFSFDVQLTK